MKTLKFLFKTLVEIGKGFAYGWIVYIIRLIKSLCRGIKAFCALRKLPHDQQLEASNPCSKFTAPAYHRPDPCIYDQYYLMSLVCALQGRHSVLCWASQKIESATFGTCKCAH